MSISNRSNSSYHHGDLRNALITAAAEMLKDQGLEALSLRKLAREIGVSHNAPYMHFADKEALLAAIAQQGFELLAEAIGDAIKQAGADWSAAFHAGCWAYVAFVLAHPGHSQVMFRYYNPQVYPDAARAALGALSLLEGIVERGSRTGELVKQPQTSLAAVVWTHLHGIAVLLASQKLPPIVQGEQTADELTRRFVDQLLFGLKPR